MRKGATATLGAHAAEDLDAQREIRKAHAHRLEQRDVGTFGPLSLRRKGLWNDLAIVASSPRYELERISSPALVIGIENDLFGIYPGSRSAAERIPGARFLGFPTGGHLWAGRQEEVVAAMRGFLNQPAAGERVE